MQPRAARRAWRRDLRDRKARNTSHPGARIVIDLALTSDDPRQIDWSEATCFRLGVDADIMQPEEASLEAIEEAKAVCGGCSMSTQCRELAESQGDGAFGVHAGEWWGQGPRLLQVCAAAACEVLTVSTYCGQNCRQAANRARKRVEMAERRASVPA